jgi:hypothetical protein
MFQWTTLRYIWEDGTSHSHRWESLKSCTTYRQVIESLAVGVISFNARNCSALFILNWLVFTARSWDSIVGIATGYGLDDRGVGVRVPVGKFSSPRLPDRLWGPSNLVSNGYRGKAAGAWADHSPTSAEVKKMWIYATILPCTFLAYCLIC